MFNIAAFNRLLRQRRQQEKVILHSADSGLNPKQTAAGMKALRLLKLTDLENLKRNDLMNFLYAMGMNPTSDVLDGKLRQLRLHREQTFTWGELAHVWALLMDDGVDEDVMMRMAFQFFDKDGNGEISVTELRTTMHELGDLLTEEEIQAFMSIMDDNNDGIIGYQEFLQTLRSEAPEFAGKAMRATEEDNCSSSSSQNGSSGGMHMPSPAGSSPSDAGFRQLLGTSPRQDNKSWLSPRNNSSGTACAVSAGPGAAVACGGAGGADNGFDGVRRSVAALTQDGCEQSDNSSMEKANSHGRESPLQQKQQQRQQKPNMRSEKHGSAL